MIGPETIGLPSTPLTYCGECDIDFLPPACPGCGESDERGESEQG